MDLKKLNDLWEEHFKKNDTSLKYSDDFCSWENRKAKMEKKVNLKEIMTDWLIENKYDGLFNADNECACILDDLMPCYEPEMNCEPGYKLPCNCPMKCDWHIGDKEDIPAAKGTT